MGPGPPGTSIRQGKGPLRRPDTRRARRFTRAVEALDRRGDAADLALKLDACLELWSARSTIGQYEGLRELVEKAEALARVLDDGPGLAQVQLRQAEAIALTGVVPRDARVGHRQGARSDRARRPAGFENPSLRAIHPGARGPGSRTRREGSAGVQRGPCAVRRDMGFWAGEGGGRAGATPRELTLKLVEPLHSILRARCLVPIDRLRAPRHPATPSSPSCRSPE
jgi:hypothetical protein